MREIGTVAFVQIQQGPLKAGEGTRRTYSPAPLLRVARLRLTWQGIIGLLADGEERIDAHHMQHPQTRNTAGGANGISMGFLGHYELMRAEFGEHLRDGVAGENIIINAPGRILPNVLGERVAFRSAQTGHVLELVNVHPAPPCEPFSQYCLGGAVSAAETKRTLQWLDMGMRGYYLTIPSQATIGMVQTGDMLLAY